MGGPNFINFIGPNFILLPFGAMTVRVTKMGNMFKVSGITGPTQNYLGLVLSTEPAAHIDVNARRVRGEDGPATIHEEKLLAAVAEGIAEVNRSHGASFHVNSVEYVATDTPDYATYAALAKAIGLAAQTGDASEKG